MKEFQSATKQDFLSQFGGYLSFKNAKGTSFLSVFNKVAEFEGCEDLNLSQPADWQFLKTKKGFIFPVPKGEYLIQYSNKMNQNVEKMSSISAGYCLTLIWLSLLLINVDLLSDEQNKKDYLIKALYEKHNSGMDEITLYFNEKERESMFNILD